MVRGACEGLGAMTLLKDLGVKSPTITLHLDSSVAKGILERQGISKVRHLDVNALWLQDQEARKTLNIAQIHGPGNPGD